MSAGYDGTIRINTKIDQTGADKGISKLSGSFKKLGVILMGVFTVKKIIDFGKKSYEAFKIANQAGEKLASAMRSNLNATDSMIQSIKDLTSVEQGLGVVEDDVQKAGLAVLSTFVKTTDSLKTLLPAMNNLIAFQYGMDATAESADAIAKAMGRAVGTGELTALTRMGIVFDEATQKAFKLANETGRVSMLSEGITKKIGDINYSLANTDLGRQQQLKNIWGDVQEVFGEAIVKFGVLFIPMLQKAVSVMDTLGKYLVGIADAFQEVFASDIGESKLSSTAIDASKAQEKLASSIEETNEAVEAGLAGFDKLNVLQEAVASENVEVAGVELGGVVVGEGTDISPDIKNTIEILKDQVMPIIEELKSMLGSVGGVLLNLWDSVIKPLSLSIVTDVLPVIKSIFDNLSKLFEDLKPYIQNIEGFLSSIISNIMNILNGFVIFISGVLSGDIEKAFGGINDIMDGFLNGVKNMYYAVLTTIQTLLKNWGIDIDLKGIMDSANAVIEGFKKSLKGIIDFIKGVFTGDWEMAWGGIKDCFIGIWDSIKGYAKLLWEELEAIFNSFMDSTGFIDKWNGFWNKFKNGFIDVWSQIVDFGKSMLNNLIWAIESGLNRITSGINVMTSGLSEAWVWAGIPPIPPIPSVQIPRLAEGGVIQPNNEFLALLGDQKSGINIETPLKTMVEAFREAMHTDHNNNNNNQNNNATIVMDGRVVGEIILPYIDNARRNIGKSLIVDRGIL